MSENSAINVCISCDNNYSKHAGVLIASILSNAKSSDNLVFYILDGGINKINKDKILSLKEIKDCEINFTPVDKAQFEDYAKVHTHKYISLPTFYRLKLPTILPDVKKIIYLDCDVVVNTSLQDLFDIDFDNNILLGVQDISSKMLKTNPTYINAGMVVMNLELMRKEAVEQKFLEYTKENINKIKTGDQEIINEVLKNRIKVVDKSWNVQSSNFTNRSCFTKTPKIIHYVSKRKPWHYASFSVHRDLYFKYRQLTPWKLDENTYKHWTKDNQIASLFAYIKYRPFFLFRPKFYYALYQEYFKNFLKSQKQI